MPANFSRLACSGGQANFGGPDLNSLDLIQLEPLLCSGLQRFFEFKGYTLHFPVVKDNEGGSRAAEYLPRERKLLLPLRRPDGPLLGVFVARGVSGGVKKIMPLLPAAVSLCLENLSFYKQSLRDPLSGLLRRGRLLDLVAHELEQIREGLRPGGPKDLIPEEAGRPASFSGKDLKTAPAGGLAGRTPAWSFRFSLMVIRLNGLPALVREHGYLRTEKLLAALAAELEKKKPGQAAAARSGDTEFALLLPACGNQASRELGQSLVAALNAVSLPDELNGHKLRIRASAGFVDCPRDLDGMERYSAPEQTRRLLRRARLAAAMAGQSALAAWENPEDKPAVLAYSGILHEGGRVLQALPLSRLEVSLGKYCGARPGQRFTLWGYVLDGGREPVRRYKGEALLVRVRPNASTAELLYCDDPSLPPQPGDQLILAGQDSLPGLYQSASAGAAPAGEQVQPARSENLDKSTGFLNYSDFLPWWCREREKYDRFSLVLARFSLPLLTGSQQAMFMEYLDGGDENDEGGLPRYDRRTWEDSLAACAARFRVLCGPSALYGRYGLNSFVVFVPETAGQNERFAQDEQSGQPRLAAKLAELSREFSGRGLHCAIGIAPYPFLDFHKSETLENVHKALEYALLLPWPHVGRLDSLALNISADRRYSLGDQLGAIAEYKKALLCDENNILAWNSLGVTLAGLGRQAEARRHFEEALERSPDDVATLYNLGQLCQSGGELGQALRLFQRCRELDPGNVYTLYRLGQLAELHGDNALARDYYRKTAKLPGGEALTRRGLARLAIREGQPEEAREELHEALLINPHDALALQLLASLYLDAGENPAVAESLARQSAALRPDCKAAWLELARALEASGKAGEAREALLRAGEL
ncbi:MAG: tetratricopeptide repeat protein [Deltaproteobacteria bacterium]|jgi:GGDEF domain-containing protein/Flp pilus assembly protein TadD|nr:tetratricopeptide repeat protein [Deltaproteobacteria bacterium]